MVNNTNYRRPNPQHDNASAKSSANKTELMNAIMEADFFAQDLKLYLNTHPDDKRAIEMYREACRQYKACKAAFEDCFWPLTACSAGMNDDCWDWPEGVWPPKSL